MTDRDRLLATSGFVATLCGVSALVFALTYVAIRYTDIDPVFAVPVGMLAVMAVCSSFVHGHLLEEAEAEADRD